MGETRYLEAAVGTLMSAWEILRHYPAEHCSLLLALEDLLQPATLIILRGPRAELISWQNHCRKYSRTTVFAIPNEERSLPGPLGNYKPSAQPVAYVCKSTYCLPTVHDLKELDAIIHSL